MKAILTTTILVSFVMNAHAQQEFDWVPKTTMQSPRGAASVALFDGCAYVFGGTDSTGFFALADVERYDIRADRWERLPDMPTPRSGAAAHVIDGEIHLFGGWNYEILASVVAFDPVSGQWTDRPDMPTARTLFRTFEIDGKILAFGGGREENSGRIDVYDPTTRTWETKKEHIPPHYWGYGAAQVEGRIVLIGGSNFGFSTGRVDWYDPATDTWEQGADMPTARGGMAVGTDGRYVYVVGGSVAHEGARGTLRGVSNVEIYDPKADAWRVEPDLPLPLAFPAGVVHLDGFYVIGGGGYGNDVTAETRLFPLANIDTQ